MKERVDMVIDEKYECHPTGKPSAIIMLGEDAFVKEIIRTGCVLGFVGLNVLSSEFKFQSGAGGETKATLRVWAAAAAGFAFRTRMA